MKDSVVILGTRGSLPVSGPEFMRYGGATTCVLVRLAGVPVVLDAGSGMLHLEQYLKPEERQISLLLSHPHADHLLGLTMCSRMFDPAFSVKIFGKTRLGLSLQQQLDRLYSPPIWPVRVSELSARVEFEELPDVLQLENVTVHVMEGVHPGGVSMFRIEGNGKCVVFMTDCTVTEENLERMALFAADCDLLLADGQYTQEEFRTRSTFGHSSWPMVMKLAERARAGQLRIMHHDPGRTDDRLHSAGLPFAYEREEILL